MAPSRWVLRFLDGLDPGARILDVACGSGRHLRAALAKGFRVTGADRDISRVRDLVGHENVTLVETDLENGQPWPFAEGSFEGVIITNYLWRPVLHNIVANVSPAGLLIYETFGVGNERFGRPHNPDFLLKPGELLEAVHGRLTVIAYELVQLPEPQRVVQRILAAGAQHQWIENPPASN